MNSIRCLPVVFTSLVLGWIDSPLAAGSTLRSLEEIAVPPAAAAHCARIRDTTNILGNRIAKGEPELTVIDDLEQRRLKGEEGLAGISMAELLDIVSVGRSDDRFSANPAAAADDLHDLCLTNARLKVFDDATAVEGALSCEGIDQLFLCIALRSPSTVLNQDAIGLATSRVQGKNLLLSGRPRSLSLGSMSRINMSVVDDRVVSQSARFSDLAGHDVIVMLSQIYGEPRMIRFDSGTVETVLKDRTMRTKGQRYRWDGPGVRVELQSAEGNNPDGSEFRNYDLIRRVVPLFNAPVASEADGNEAMTNCDTNAGTDKVSNIAEQRMNDPSRAPHR